MHPSPPSDPNLQNVSSCESIGQQSRQPPVVLRSPLIFMAAITTQVVRDAATCGALSCVILGLHSDARNMELLTTELGRHRQQDAGGQRRHSKIQVVDHRNPWCLFCGYPGQVKAVSHQFSFFYLRQHKRIPGLGFTGRHSSCNSNTLALVLLTL
jgi:hypothetical protein